MHHYNKVEPQCPICVWTVTHLKWFCSVLHHIRFVTIMLKCKLSALRVFDVLTLVLVEQYRKPALFIHNIPIVGQCLAQPGRLNVR